MSLFLHNFLKHRPLGRFFLVVAMSVYISVYLYICPLPMGFFLGPHWPSGHMIRSLRLISLFLKRKLMTPDILKVDFFARSKLSF